MNILADYECEGQITMDQYLSDLESRASPERCASCKWHYPPRYPCMIYKKIPKDCSESYRAREE
jgi:hypothetical protein